jgi:hypothetical protein
MVHKALFPPKTVSREEWLATHKAFFLREKAVTHELALRWTFPWFSSENGVISSMMEAAG